MNATKVVVPSGHDSAMVSLLPPRAGDCLSESVSQEIQRRLVVFTLKPDQQIIRSQTPPSDKSAYWIQIDSNGKVVGFLQAYDPATGTWINVSSIGACISQDPKSLLKVDSNGCLIVAGGLVPGYCEVTPTTVTQTAGAGTVPIQLQGFLDIQAEVNVAYQSDPGANARWWVTGQTENGLTVNFAGLANNVAVLIYARRSTLA